jgi:hypothetical protein
MRSHGPEKSIDLFPAATWGGYNAIEFPRADYPGLRPTGSWTLSPGGELHGVDPTDAGWCDRETGERVDVSGRHLVLAYGSNPDPAKLLNREDRQGFFGGDAVIALRAAVFGWAAGWCDARRGSDRSVVATLVQAPRRVEVHPVLALTPHQREAMDRWEGHPDCYRRLGFEGVVVLESGEQREDVEVYLGTPGQRPPLVTGDGHLLLADVIYADVDHQVSRR